MSVHAVKWALYRSPLLLTEKGNPDSTARQVLAVLAEHADDDGRKAYPSVLRIRLATGLDERTIQRALGRLEKGDLASRTGVHESGATIWRLHMDRVRPESDWEQMRAEADEVRRVESERRRERRHKAAETVSGTEDPGQAGDVRDAESRRPARKVPASGTENPDVRDAAPPEPSLEPSLNHQEPPPPPKPPADTSPPSGSSETEGEESFEDQKTRLVDDIRRIRPTWGKRGIIAAMQAALDDGRPWPAIHRAYPIVAADPETNSPGRLNADGPWWDQPEVKATRPPWCGRCTKIERHVEVESGYGEGIKVGRCQTCHPEVVRLRRESDPLAEYPSSFDYDPITQTWTDPQPAAQTNPPPASRAGRRRPYANGGRQPFRNPEDVSVYDLPL